MRGTVKLLQRVAILYQSKLPPMKNGVQKPMKSGGYSDSGADIAFQLKSLKTPVVTPRSNPSVENDLDWVFPDHVEGIQAALDRGADTLWLNTVLFNGHPIEQFFGKGLQFVGQLPSKLDLHDDKLLTNDFLRNHGLSFSPGTLISNDQVVDAIEDVVFPCVIKPVRGRGSQGVFLVENQEKMQEKLRDLFSCRQYGNALYVEKFLAGQEITVTVMPAGRYSINHEIKEMTNPWSLPAVRRYNHVNGIAPYNGSVAVMENSCVLDDEELESKQIRDVYTECEKAFSLVGARAPIRIDCRADENGKYWLFDLNMKPSITGACRPHRRNQDSLSAIAARQIGWNYGDLLLNMLGQRWKY